MKSPSRMRPLLVPSMLWLVHLVLLYALDATRVVGHLLGAVRPDISLVLLVAAFSLLRLFVMFAIPGWLVLALVRVVRAPEPNGSDPSE